MTDATERSPEPSGSREEDTDASPETASTPAGPSNSVAQAMSALAARTRSIGSSLRSQARRVFGGSGKAAARQGRRGFELSLRVARERAFPWLASTSAALREHSRPSVIKRDYHQGLLFVHEKLFDRQVEELSFVSSDRGKALSELKIGSITRLSGRDYKPTPRLVFRWAMESIPEQPSAYTFVDFGAGRGRVLLLASHLNFSRIVGVEFAEELHNDCEQNIAQYPRSLMKCREVECVHQDATLFELPDGPTIFYFFHPFDSKIMTEVLGRIAHSYDRNPRRLYLVCIDMPDRQPIEAQGIFRPFALPGLQGLKVSLLSPYSIDIYRTAT